MGLPKNYNQTEQRVEALNDLNFYTVKYEYELTDMNDFTEEQIDVIYKEVNGTKEFSALNNIAADNKINEWLQSLVTQKILKEHSVTETHSVSFHDKLVETRLLNILEL